MGLCNSTNVLQTIMEIKMVICFSVTSTNNCHIIDTYKYSKHMVNLIHYTPQQYYLAGLARRSLKTLSASLSYLQELAARLSWCTDISIFARNEHSHSFVLLSTISHVQRSCTALKIRDNALGSIVCSNATLFSSCLFSTGLFRVLNRTSNYIFVTCNFLVI